MQVLKSFYRAQCILLEKNPFTRIYFNPKDELMNYDKEEQYPSICKGSRTIQVDHTKLKKLQTVVFNERILKILRFTSV